MESKIWKKQWEIIPIASEINTHINNIRHKLNKIHQILSDNE